MLINQTFCSYCGDRLINIVHLAYMYSAQLQLRVTQNGGIVAVRRKASYTDPIIVSFNRFNRLSSILYS